VVKARRQGGGFLKRNAAYMIIMLTIIWLILREEVTLWSVLTGLVFGTLCVLFCRKFLPLDKIAGVNYFWFLLYLFYLIGQMYLGALSAIRLVVKGAKADVISVNTEITNDFLRVMLANSITIVPGSVTLEIKAGRITVLSLHDKGWGMAELTEAGDRIVRRLEKRLIKAQK